MSGSEDHDLGPESRQAIVERGYAALDRDDVAAFVALCAPDIEWVYPAVDGLLYGGTWRGHEGVVAFLEAHDAAEEILDFRIEELVAQGDRVVALGFFRGRALATGREWQTRFVHSITLRDGLWARVEDYFDTAAAMAARTG